MSDQDPQEKQDSVDDSLSMIVVIIEWDGRKPKTSFYNRMHEYGLYVRMGAGTEQSLLEWRASQRGKKKNAHSYGVVLNESTIAVSSQSLARDIAAWAEEYGAKMVYTGLMSVTKFVMSDKDHKHFMRMQQSISKRGPKVTSETGVYTVTCFDEVRTFAVDLTSEPVQCPWCGCSNIQTRMGQVQTFHSYQQADCSVGDYWLRTRFASHQFEIPVLKENKLGEAIYPSPKFNVPDVKVPEFVDLPEAMLVRLGEDAEYCFRAYDVAWCVSKMNPMSRSQGRIGVINSYAMSGGQNFLSFVPPANGLDLVDLCILEEAYTEYL
jgi:hypothetical protein